MQATVRSYLTAGVALAGAGALAIAPVSPVAQPADIQVAPMASVSTPLHLTAVSNPLEAFFQLFGNTAGNTTGLFEQFLESPAPILEQLFTNQVANLEFVGEVANQMIVLLPDLLEEVQSELGVFVEQLSSGEFIEAGDTLTGLLLPLGLPLLPLLAVPLNLAQNMTQNIANVPTALITNVFNLLVPIIGLADSAIGATFDAMQGVSDAFDDGDFLTAGGIVASAPIVIIDAVLNGFDDGETGLGIGLLTPMQSAFSWGGPIAALMQLRNVIADALTPIPTTAMAQAAANQAPDLRAPLVALGVAAEEQDGEEDGKTSDGSDDTEAADEAPAEATDTDGAAADAETAETATGSTDAEAIEVTETVEAEPELAKTAERTTLTRDSFKAEPGQSATRSIARDAAKDVRSGINGAVDNVRSGIERITGSNPSSSANSGAADSSGSGSGSDSDGGDD